MIRKYIYGKSRRISKSENIRKNGKKRRGEGKWVNVQDKKNRRLERAKDRRAKRTQGIRERVGKKSGNGK